MSRVIHSCPVAVLRSPNPHLTTIAANPTGAPDGHLVTCAEWHALNAIAKLAKRGAWWTEATKGLGVSDRRMRTALAKLEKARAGK